jgi:methionyl-tRNA formyltransferase
MNDSAAPPFVFFGTDSFSVAVLNALEKDGFLPTSIVTLPARKAGRGLKLHEPEVKEWADIRNIKTLQPTQLNQELVATLTTQAPATGWPVFILASYGALIPKEILELPSYGILNVHPSLLPKYRGASPLQTQLLEGEQNIGVTLMAMDEKMDHGDIVTSEKLTVPNTKHYSAHELSEKLGEKGGALLAQVLPDFIHGKIHGTPQNHKEATFTHKIKKTDGKINLSDEGILNYRKYLAYNGWPGIFFFENGKRIKITQAIFKDGAFIPTKVIPEGKKEIDWDLFVKNNIVR